MNSYFQQKYNGQNTIGVSYFYYNYFQIKCGLYVFKKHKLFEMTFLLLLFCILISTPVWCLPASGVTLHIDISMFVSGLAKDVAILQYGVVDELTMRLASSISMPDNITYAEFNWNTDNIEEPELYEIDISSTNYKVLLSDITGIEPSGVVPTEATEYNTSIFNLF